MTTITIYNTRNKDYKGFRVEGHAGFAVWGKDIVCAAISVLVINTINSIETFTGDKILAQSNEKTGLITCDFHEIPSSQSVLLLDSMVLGLTDIEKKYGKKFLKLKFEEV